MECRQCKNEMKKHVRKFDIFHVCEECATGEIEYLKDQCCVSPELIAVNLPRVDGKPTKRMFCNHCGEKSSIVKMTHPKECDSLPLFSKELSELLFNQRNDLRSKFREYISELYQDKKQKWFNEEYSKYLNSPEWRHLRLKVLKRDNYLCQCCLTSKATEVHHLSYDNYHNLPAYYLKSVCSFCHEQITAMSRGEIFKPIHTQFNMVEI